MGAVILLAIGIADWLTTRAILAAGGGEGNPVARWLIARLGFTRFFVGKALVMCLFGAVATPLPGGWWAIGAIAACYAAVLVNNAIVLRRLRARRR